MKKEHDWSDCPRDEAALHAIGALDPEEATEFAAHLKECPVCLAESESLSRTAASLGALAPAMSPPPSLRERLVSAIGRVETPVARLAARLSRGAAPAAEPGLSPAGSAEFAIVRGGEEGWQPTGVGGVTMRSLFVDEANDRITLLVRMEPGTDYPSHRHGGVEECYVLEGDLCGPDFEMQAGDYQRLAGGSVHGRQFTRGGCLLFIVSSLHDEMLGAHA